MNKKFNIKKHINRSNIITAILVFFGLALVFKPNFKGQVIQGLMKIGLFQPSIPKAEKNDLVELASYSQNEAVLFKDKNGKNLDLADLKGKVVFINFWATWCPPCIAEMPTIQTLFNTCKEDERIVFLLVDVDNDIHKSQKFMDKKKFNLPVYTPASPIPSNFLGGSIPTTLVLNKNGKIVFHHEGTADYSNKEFINYVKQLTEQ